MYFRSWFIYFFVLEQCCLLSYIFSGGHFIIIISLISLRFSSMPVCSPSSSGKILRTHEYPLMWLWRDMRKLFLCKAPQFLQTSDCVKLQDWNIAYLTVCSLFLLFSCSVLSNSLKSHELQHTRLSCPLLFPEFAQIHVKWVSDTIQLSHPLLSPFLLAFNFPQHHGLF